MKRIIIRLAIASAAFFSFQTFADPIAMDPSRRDYLSEVTNAQLDANLLVRLAADPAILQYQARTQKLFEFVSGDPEPFFDQMRREQPNFEIPPASGKVIDVDSIKHLKGVSKILNLPPIFVISRYADVTEIMHENKVFSVQAYAGPIVSITGGPFMLATDEAGANQEKPDMGKSLAGKERVEQIRKIVDHLAQNAIREGADNGTIDIVKSVTRAIPLGMNAEYFGFNGPDQDTLARWTKAAQMAIFYNFGQEQSVIQAAADSGVEMQTYLSQKLLPSRLRELKNGRPANDVISRLLTLSAMHARHGVSSERIVANIIGLLVGSVETTSAAITQSLGIILENPAIREQAIRAALADDNETVAKIVWEALRFHPVNHWVARISTEPYSLAKGTARETLIPAGSLILASTESAMFDEDVFPQANEFRLDRDQTAYLHFGYEYHRCLGVDVASTMVPEGVKELLKLKDVQAAAPLHVVDPFPESYVLKFAANSVTPAANLALNTPNDRADALTYDGFSSGHSSPEAARTALIAELAQPDAEAIPDLVENALSEMTAPQQIKSCSEQNQTMSTLFPDASLRKDYCSVRTEFRSCYLAQTEFAKQPSFTAYYACAYGQNYLSADERAGFKSKFANDDRFYFLNLENVGQGSEHR